MEKARTVKISLSYTRPHPLFYILLFSLSCIATAADPNTTYAYVFFTPSFGSCSECGKLARELQWLHAIAMSSSFFFCPPLIFYIQKQMRGSETSSTWPASSDDRVQIRLWRGSCFHYQSVNFCLTPVHPFPLHTLAPFFSPPVYPALH